jgi:thiamine-phosphate pyrophosphorylase
LINRTEFILCYVTDRRGMGVHHEIEPLVERIGAAARTGVDWIQIREKDLSGREWMELARRAVREARAAAPQAKVIVNDRLDVAIATGADGVHLGEKSIAVRDALEYREKCKSRLAREFLVGTSSHSVEKALEAEREGADYVFFGPVFATPSKAGLGEPQGVEKLAEVCTRVKIPVLAIGGVAAENTGECARADAAGVAAIRAFQDEDERKLHQVVARMKERR